MTRLIATTALAIFGAGSAVAGPIYTGSGINGLDLADAGVVGTGMPCTVGTVELTMSHVGLGTLTESALMVLFGNAHAHRLVAGTGRRPDALVDH